MEKLIYFEPMFSDRRERLIDLCVNLQKQGRSFIYILPSREAIRDVRFKLLERLGGFINSKVIMFDELERDITGEFIKPASIIFQDVEKMMLRGVCENLQGKLKYFDKICTKTGFIEESRNFIKALKRDVIYPEILDKSLDKVTDPILKDKLLDLQLLYSEYRKALEDKKLYDVNDISLIAVEKAPESSVFNETAAIIIDGFINIDKVNLELIGKLALANKLDIYVNCPYINDFSREFLDKEIREPLEEMEFKSLTEAEGFHKIKEAFRELSMNYYSGNKVSQKPIDIIISKYPCIAAEVRETARSIKEKLIKGEKSEDIAVFVNNSDEYSSAITKVFKEFSIPLYMNYELPLSISQLGRDLLNSLKELEKASTTVEEWVAALKEKFQKKSLDLVMLAKEAFNVNLSYEDIQYLKSKDALEKLIGDLKQSLELSGMLQKELSIEEFINIYIDYLNNNTMTLAKPSSFGIKILNTDLAKGVFYKHVYILGINEGEMPKIIKNDGLFDELEINKLKTIGIQYEDYLWELFREKLRFNLTLSAARESLTLSYRGSTEEGKFAIASSLLEEVKYTAGLENIMDVSMRERFYVPINRVMSSRELKAMKLKSFFEKKYKGFNALDIHEQIELIENFEHQFRDTLFSGLVEYHRSCEKDFNKFEGVLKGNIEKVMLSKNSFSPSKLDTYFNCPFKYLLQNLFKLQEEQEEENELSALELGDLYHKVLYYYYDGLKNFDVLEEIKFEASFTKAFEETRKLDISEGEIKMLKAKLKETIRNFIECDLKRINNYEKQTGNIIRPFMLERFFESEVFGELITARVDRVDLEYKLIEGLQVPTGRYIVYDYKKNSIPKIDKILNRENCQIAFYYYFVEEYLKDKLEMKELDCMALLYLSIEGTKKSQQKNGLYRTEYKKALGFDGKNKYDLNKELFYTLLEYLRTLIKESIAAIQEGVFPYKLNCSCFDKFSHSNCDYVNICRYSKDKMTAIGGV